MTHIGDQLTALLDRIGMPRGRVAVAIGVSRQHLLRLTKGEAHPTVPLIVRILAFLNAAENLKRLGRKTPVRFEDLLRERKAA